MTRIQELLAQCTDNQMVMTHQVDLDKFAELIVRECAKVANENVGLFTPGCGNSVLEHFGVE